MIFTAAARIAVKFSFLAASISSVNNLSISAKSGTRPISFLT